MNPAMQRFGPNPDGRDFVVGDIHGEFERLNEQLERLKFNPDVDRLFSVGDLVDRGPDSADALDWLSYPWFHAVLGNHEAMLIDTTLNKMQLRWWLFSNGGEWWLSQDEETRERFRAALQTLPLACEVETTGGGRVGIVHADVPAGLDWDEFVRRLESDQEVRRDALWSRARVYADTNDPVGDPVGGVDEVYCGHTPIAATLTVGNVRFIDTGACFGGPLTVLRIDDRALPHT